VISPTHRLLRDKTQHSQQTDVHANGRIRTRNPIKRAATGAGSYTYSDANLTQRTLRTTDRI